jgi:hypothetical protein
MDENLPAKHTRHTPTPFALYFPAGHKKLASALRSAVEILASPILPILTFGISSSIEAKREETSFFGREGAGTFGNAAHSRLAVEFGSTVAYSTPGMQVRTFVHTRSVIVVAGLDSNCVALHADKGEQVTSDWPSIFDI